MGKTYCKECVFCDEQIDPKNLGRGQLYCRRYPPTPHAIVSQAGMQSISLFPPVTREMWCAEGQISVTTE